MQLGSIRQWHWISAAVSLAGMLVFAITGITLNHAADIGSSADIRTLETQLPTPLLNHLQQVASEQQEGVPASLTQWLRSEHGIRLGSNASAEWTEQDVYVVMAGPGVDAWLAIDFEFNEVSYERTDRGWIAYFNDLHKGRDTGIAWSWFIDVFALVCVVFCVTGLILLFRQTRHRPMTWPVTALGVIAPLIILLVFVH